MATKTFTTMVQIEGFIESACAKAVEITCNRLLGTLQELIMSEYYDLFDPEKYRRTMQFYDSATTRILNKLTGEIFMDADSMNYGAYWDGETQLYMADAGFHGSVYDYEDGHFWKEFIAYCEKNAKKILKEELVKQGLKLV